MEEPTEEGAAMMLVVVVGDDADGWSCLFGLVESGIIKTELQLLARIDVKDGLSEIFDESENG